MILLVVINMKKILSVSVLIGFLAVLLLPIAASAVDIPQPAETCTMSREMTIGTLDCDDEGGIHDIGGPYAMCCLMNTLYNIVDWMFVILVGVAGIFVIFGAFQILTAGGNPERLTTGRQYIMYAAIGLAVALLARAIPGIVTLIVGI